jgi:CheY-like chemotaxis protein
MEKRIMTEKITLILADDHAMVRKGLTAFLATAQDIEVVAVAECGVEVVAAAKKHAPDVVLLDLFMPDQPAVETVRQIKKVSPRSQIIMVTSHEGDEYVVPMTQAGAISYILKDTTPEDLIRAVRKALEYFMRFTWTTAVALVATALSGCADDAIIDSLLEQQAGMFARLVWRSAYSLQRIFLLPALCDRMTRFLHLIHRADHGFTVATILFREFFILNPGGRKAFSPIKQRQGKRRIAPQRKPLSLIQRAQPSPNCERRQTPSPN